MTRHAMVSNEPQLTTVLVKSQLASIRSHSFHICQSSSQKCQPLVIGGKNSHNGNRGMAFSIVKTHGSHLVFLSNMALKIAIFLFLVLESYTLTTNSGLTYEKPWNSVWSRFMINNLSVGVNLGGSDVNSRSKLLTSLRLFWKWNRHNLDHQITEIKIYSIFWQTETYVN